MNSFRTTIRTFSSRVPRARVVVVGSGRMGHIRSSLLYANPRVDLVGIVDTNVNSAITLADTYQTDAFESLEDAMAKGLVDGVVVASPTFTHEAVITESAAHNNVFIFTEKPVDETAEKIKHLFSVKSNICCGFQRRFDKSYVAAAEAVKQNSIGTPVTANLFFADHPCPPPEYLLTGGGNIIMDLAPHDVDYIMNVLDDDVVSVYATGTSSTPELEAAGVHDNATMMMKFSKGTIVTLFMSRSATYGYDQRCEIFGSKGLVAVGNEHDHSTVVSDKSGIHLSRLEHSFPQRFNQAFASEMDAFCDTMLLGTPWPVTANDCIRVQRVADAASRSIELDQVVQIESDDPAALQVRVAL